MVETTQIRMTAEEFAKLPETNTPTELIHGEVIVAPSPTYGHQVLSRSLEKYLDTVSNDGLLLHAPMDVHLDEENVVQPDIFWISGPESACQPGKDNYLHGAPDLVIEIVSPGSKRRDGVEKFLLYEQSGSLEYWVVDSETKQVQVWTRDGNQFINYGTFGADSGFTSPVLNGVEIDLKRVFD